MNQDHNQDHGMEQLLNLVAKLRDPIDGCPWDIAQTFASTVPHTLEEAYEVADAIEKNDLVLLKEELGDLLLQIVLYSQIAKEKNLFAFADITAGITEKLIRRHPHVFGNANGKVGSAEEQLAVWEALKKDEQRSKNQPSRDGIATALPALARAKKLCMLLELSQVDSSSFFSIIETIEEKATELRSSAMPKEQNIGDLLFACVNLARKLQIDPEVALRQANGRAERLLR
ncbi:Nucleoside triphosphate pyrophosphohydrolase MazG [invertebrate metagenome]|uniref:Nucleoside triphosphate pyrophosphohydrolase MazG n=1 Tax=invertebrate metagenome TaxID=1711999 RepID=A0A484H8Z7_9ZZZZ